MAGQITALSRANSRPNSRTSPLERLSKSEIERQMLEQALVDSPGYFDNLMLQSRTVVSQDYTMARTMMDMADTARREAWRQLESWMFEMTPFFQSTVEREDENMDFWLGHQWTKADIQKITAAGQNAYISNRQWRKVLTLLGEMRGAKTEFRAYPQDPTSKLYAQLANDLLAWVVRDNEWPDVEPEIFRDAVVGGRGVAMVRLDPTDPLGRIDLRRCRPREFMHDIDSAEDGSLSTSRIITRSFFEDLDSVLLRYPHWADYLRRQNFDRFWTDCQQWFMLNEPKVHSKVSDIKVPTTLHTHLMRTRRRMWITEKFTRRYEPVWRVEDVNRNISHDFETEPQAAAFFQQIAQGYYHLHLAETGEEQDPMVIEPRQVMAKVVDMELWCNNIFMDKQLSKGWEIPYEFHIPHYVDGQMVGFFENDKSHQRLINRVLTLVDMLASAGKGKTFINKAKLGKNWTEDKLKASWNKPTEPIIFDNMALETLDGVALNFPPPNNGTTIPALLDIVREGEQMQMAGLNSIGMMEHPGQSARSQEINLSTSQSGTVPIFDTLHRFERRIGEKILYAAQFLHPRKRIAVTDKREQTRFFSVLDYGIQSIADLKFTIEVREVKASPSRQQQKLNTIMVAAQNNPGFIEDASDVILELSDIDQTYIDRIQQNKQARQEGEQAQFDREMSIKEFAEQEKWRLADLDRQLRARELEIKANPPVAVSASTKFPLGPNALAEIYRQHNIDADAIGVLQDHTAQSIYDQGERNVTQEEYNARDVEYQRKVAQFQPKPGGGEKPKNVSKPKDANNRKQRNNKQERLGK